MHLHTLHLEHTYLLAVYTLLTLANTRLHRGMRGVQFFVLYSVLALLGGIAVACRGSMSDFFSIVLGNVFVLAAYTALYASMSRLFSFSARQNAMACVWLGAGTVGMLWYGSVHPDTPKRLIGYSVVLAVQQAHLAGLLLLGSHLRRRLSWMLASMLIALAMANMFRLSTVLLQGAPQDYRQSGQALAVVVLANSCLQCGIMVAYVWMTAALLRRRLELQASTDPLTGLSNRRALEEAAEAAIRSSNGRIAFSAIQIDLDRYKPINDRLGHAAGDQALRAVASCLRGCLRDSDTLARSGGDEFVALLPRTPADAAVEIAERMRACLESLNLGLPDPTARITGSFGVAERAADEPWDRVLFHCDHALYTVKSRGGNGVLRHGATAAFHLNEVFLAVG